MSSTQRYTEIHNLLLERCEWGENTCGTKNEKHSNDHGVDVVAASGWSPRYALTYPITCQDWQSYACSNLAAMLHAFIAC